MTVQSLGHDDPLAPVASTARDRALALAEAEALAGRAPEAIRLLDDLAHRLSRFTPGNAPVIADLDELSEDGRNLVLQVLGEGEVHGVVNGPEDVQITESVMPGLWLVQSDSRSMVEINDVPGVLKQAAHDGLATDFDIPAAPDGAMNVMPVLHEVRERIKTYQEGQANHVISFTLLPMSESDMKHLKQVLGLGPLHVMSRGYGNCRIMATAVRNVWSVQYMNTMDTVILDTLEIGGIPVSVCAAREDFEDSGERLSEILEAYL